MNLDHGFKQVTLSGWRTPVLLALTLLLMFGCVPSGKSEEELRKEIQSLKSEVTALQEKLTKLEAGQQAILTQLKQSPVAPPATQPGEAPKPSEPLTVSQLITGKDRFIGTRVTVKGPVGPVLVHHKSLLLKAPEGLVEVFFGSLPDDKQINRLTSTPLDQPITVTGVVSMPTRGGAKLQIMAETVDF
jgi:hypothetical protein